MAQFRILKVALDTPLDFLFDYGWLVEDGAPEPQVGQFAVVPFGRRETTGLIVDIADSSDLAPEKLKNALAVRTQLAPLTPQWIALCRFAADYYQRPLGEVAVPGVPKNLRAENPVSLNRALKKIGQDRPAPDATPAGMPLLNPAQQQAADAVADAHGFAPMLLYGVTGSGKTEVYLQLIRETLEAGKQALVLIPEINLGPQTLARFEQRFNARIALLHSAVNDRERLDAWLAARDGEADIIIGTRSALFTPMKNPGLIIIDEEHDGSYKQQEGLRYHARDLALVRAHQENVPILLGSATPSLESLHNAHTGRYGLLRMNHRAGGAKQPRFLRLDVRSRPLDSGISGPLQQAIGKTLEAGQQVLVFLNRRGFAPTLLCHDCGWMSGCPRCDARMTVHQRSGVLRCHHCGYDERLPLRCPKCAHVDLRPVGAGTERAEERLKVLFPDFPVLRVDRDSTSRKDAMHNLFTTIQRGQPSILVGTQMLAKGHHFPRVTLVAILDADGGLFSGDFRASERMAQLIVQVAGRAGRAEEPGKVIVQTHLAEHPLLVQLTEEGYFAFAEQALSERRGAGLPPFAHLALLRAEAHKPGQAEGFLDEACSAAERLLAEQGGQGIELLGPVPAPMERRAGRFRAQLLLQASARAPLHRLISAWLLELEQMPSGRQVRWSLDVDPVDLY